MRGCRRLPNNSLMRPGGLQRRVGRLARRCARESRGASPLPPGSIARGRSVARGERLTGVLSTRLRQPTSPKRSLTVLQVVPRSCVDLATSVYIECLLCFLLSSIQEPSSHLQVHSCMRYTKVLFLGGHQRMGPEAILCSLSIC